MNFSKSTDVALGSVCFCLLSSIIYVINDICDVEKDRKHPTKRNRPLASGAIPLKNAYLLLGIMGGLLACILAYRRNTVDLCFLFIYLILNIGYSMGLKNIALLDVIILTSGYLIRLLYGGTISGIAVSDWMFLTVFSAACYLSFGKRRNELRICGDDNRKVLKMYTYSFLDKSVQLFLTLTLVFYSLSCADSETVVARAGINFMWSVPIVFIIFLRYNMLLESEDCDGDPIEVVFRDKITWILILIYIVMIVCLLFT